jgi:hypothetical protein
MTLELFKKMEKHGSIEIISVNEKTKKIKYLVKRTGKILKKDFD